MGNENVKPEVNVAGDGNVSQTIYAEKSSLQNIVQAIINVYPSSSLEELNSYLAHAVAVYEKWIYKSVHSRASPEHPYKFLYPFELQDSHIFFGRDVATAELLKTVARKRLTILHARSGAGKTSLLKAGLSPRLVEEERLPVYARAYQDPVLSIKQAIASPAIRPWPELLHKLKLHEFLGLVCTHVSHDFQEIVIILDQFEEFFVFWPERHQRQDFVNALAECYQDQQLNVSFVIGIRGDYFTHLATFERYLTEIFHNQYYLDAMTRQEASVAITGPIEMTLGRQVTYEEPLLRTLLDDLTRGGMELPHLQIICSRLYTQALEIRKPIITLATYESLGCAEGILSGYLNDVLKRLPGRGGQIAKDVLKELVSSAATKRVLSHRVLAARIQAAPNELDEVLTLLVKDRLLRRDEVEGEIIYDMAHEYLIQEIKRWIDQSDLAFKQVQELLMREVANWRVHKTLIPKDRLELLHAHLERFKGLDDETLECLVVSALGSGYAIDDWGKLAGKVGEKMFLPALASSSERIRRGALRNLGKIWGLEAVGCLGSDDWQTRWQAVETLGRLQASRVIDLLVVALQDENSTVRLAAVGVIAKRGNPCFVEPLIAALNDRDSEIRLQSALTLGRLGDQRSVGPLVRASKDHCWWVRKAAIATLGRFSGTDVVKALVAALEDNMQEVRDQAVSALAERGGASTANLLIGALRDRKSNIHRAVIAAIAKMGQSAVNPLITTLKDANAQVRREATYCLGVLWELPALRQLGNDDATIRQASAEALGQVGDPRVVEPLIAALRDENNAVCQASIEALKKIRQSALDSLIVNLRDENTDIRLIAARALPMVGESDAIVPLLTALNDKEASVRCIASEALGALGDQRSVESLVTAMNDENATVRQTVAQSLGQLGHPQAVESLIAALQDSDRGVRASAARALGRFYQRAAEPLLVALHNSDREVRQAAAIMLGKLGDSCAVEPLISALQDKDSGVCREAAMSLGNLGDRRAAQSLVTLMGIGDLEVLQVVVEALGKLGDLCAVEPLVSVLGNENIEVRNAVIEALAKIGKPAVEPLGLALRSKTENVSQTAVEALIKIGRPAFEIVCAGLKDQRKSVRVKAALALESLGDSRGVEPLVVALRDKDEDVRAGAARALGKLGDVQAVGPLIAALRDGDSKVRANAVVALQELGDLRAVPPLVAVLHDKKSDVRLRAVNALRKLGGSDAVKPLIDTLRDVDASVRQTVVEALGELGDLRAVKPLQSVAQSDQHGVVREIAIAALGKLDDVRARVRYRSLEIE